MESVFLHIKNRWMWQQRWNNQLFTCIKSSNKKEMASKKVKSTSSQALKSPPELETNSMRTHIYDIEKHLQDDCIYAFSALSGGGKKNQNRLQKTKEYIQQKKKFHWNRGLAQKKKRRRKQQPHFHVLSKVDFCCCKVGKLRDVPWRWCTHSAAVPHSFVLACMPKMPIILKF